MSVLASMRAMAAACMIMSGRSGSARGSWRSWEGAAGRVGSGSVAAISEWTVLGRRQARSKPGLPSPAPAPGGGSMAGGRNPRSIWKWRDSGRARSLEEGKGICGVA